MAMRGDVRVSMRAFQFPSRLCREYDRFADGCQHFFSITRKKVNSGISRSNFIPKILTEIGLTSIYAGFRGVTLLRNLENLVFMRVSGVSQISEGVSQKASHF